MVLGAVVPGPALAAAALTAAMTAAATTAASAMAVSAAATSSSATAKSRSHSRRSSPLLLARGPRRSASPGGLPNDRRSFDNNGNDDNDDDDGYGDDYSGNNGRSGGNSNRRRSYSPHDARFEGIPSRYLPRQAQSLIKLMQDPKQLGSTLLGLGLMMSFAGMMLFFEGNLLRLGNICILAGVPLLLGPETVRDFFLQKKRMRATIIISLGIFLVLYGKPRMGILCEIFGLLNLFGNMNPLVVSMIKKVPVLGDLVIAFEKLLLASPLAPLFSSSPSPYDYDPDSMAGDGVGGQEPSFLSRGLSAFSAFTSPQQSYREQQQQQQQQQQQRSPYHQQHQSQQQSQQQPQQQFPSFTRRSKKYTPDF